jgi:hypothetical protein
MDLSQMKDAVTSNSIDQDRVNSLRLAFSLPVIECKIGAV